MPLCQRCWPPRGGLRGPRTKRQRSVGAERPAEPRDRMPPQRHRSRCLRPSKHRRGRSARKAAPAPKPVGAARSGRSLLDGVQPVSRLPGKQSPAYWQDRSRGTPTQLLRSEVASVWRGRDHCGSGALAPEKNWPRFGTGRECSVTDGTFEQGPQSTA
jgi:hypothetical protein